MTRARLPLLLLIASLAVTACTPTATEPGATPSTEATAPSPETTAAPTTAEATTTSPELASAVASSYLQAASGRDLEAAASYLSETVFLDWGPAGTAEELAAGWAWEDAFTVSHMLDTCKDSESPSAAIEVVQCRLLVESEVAAAAGNDPAHVCIEVAVEESVIKSIIALDSEADCPMNYWEYMFVPFSDWLAEAHPEITVQEMYADRTSSEGLALWTAYTQEFLADN